MINALFVEKDGIYRELLGAEHCWDERRDARLYDGPGPVVAHPPCSRWGRMAVSVFARTGKEEHRPGNDGGCFASALAAVRRFGGVLEHPASSKAWPAHWLERPGKDGWAGHGGHWVCEVWQSAYGHLASKATWLVYCGKSPPHELRWARVPGAHIVSQSSKRKPSGKPRLIGAQNIATPRAFARELVALAERAGQ